DVEDRGHERRSRRTVFSIWGEPLAINAGDAMFVLAQLALARAPTAGIDPQVALSLLRVLNRACLDLTRGQHLDLCLEGRPDVMRDQYFAMISGKTAALLGCAAQLGALSGDSRLERSEYFRSFGEKLGIAFQIQDDLLGIWGAPSETGKAQSDDVFKRKVTLP